MLDSQEANTLTHIDFSQPIVIPPTVTHVDLSSSQLTSSHVMKLAKALMGNTKIVAINLANNLIDDVGVKALAKCLPNSHIQELYLQNNQFGNEGLQALAQALPNNLRRLFVYGNYFDVVPDALYLNAPSSGNIQHLRLGPAFDYEILVEKDNSKQEFSLTQLDLTTYPGLPFWDKHNIVTQSVEELSVSPMLKILPNSILSVTISPVKFDFPQDQTENKFTAFFRTLLYVQEKSNLRHLALHHMEIPYQNLNEFVFEFVKCFSRESLIKKYDKLSALDLSISIPEPNYKGNFDAERNLLEHIVCDRGLEHFSFSIYDKTNPESVLWSTETDAEFFEKVLWPHLMVNFTRTLQLELHKADSVDDCKALLDRIDGFKVKNKGYNFSNESVLRQKVELKLIKNAVFQNRDISRNKNIDYLELARNLLPKYTEYLNDLFESMRKNFHIHYSSTPSTDNKEQGLRVIKPMVMLEALLFDIKPHVDEELLRAYYFRIARPTVDFLCLFFDTLEEKPYRTVLSVTEHLLKSKLVAEHENVYYNDTKLNLYPTLAHWLLYVDSQENHEIIKDDFTRIHHAFLIMLMQLSMRGTVDNDDLGYCCARYIQLLVDQTQKMSPDLRRRITFENNRDYKNLHLTLSSALLISGVKRLNCPVLNAFISQWDVANPYDSYCSLYKVLVEAQATVSQHLQEPLAHVLSQNQSHFKALSELSSTSIFMCNTILLTKTMLDEIERIPGLGL